MPGMGGRMSTVIKAKISKLLASEQTLKAIGEVDDPRQIPAMWKNGLEEFKKAREKHLIYK